jgi:hypothetical protein
MNRLVIERGGSTNEGTFGEATLVNAAGVTLWHGDSIELPWRNNQHMISCVPAGVYETQIVWFARLNLNVYELLNVPNRTSCLIHPANWAGDTAMGFHTDLEGCTGLGYGIGVIAPPGMAAQQAILRTVDAIHDFMNASEGDTLEVEYRWLGPNPEQSS